MSYVLCSTNYMYVLCVTYVQIAICYICSNVLSPLLNYNYVLCPIHSTKYVLCSTNYVLCSTNYVLCSTKYVLCSTNYVLCHTNYVLCPTNYVLCPTNYVLCSTNYVLCSTNYVLCPIRSTNYCMSFTSCAAVQTRPPYPCKQLGELLLNDQIGYMSSVVTDEYGFGSNKCPWVVMATKGRKINMTLLDFGVAARYQEAGNTCHVYAKISEMGLTSDMPVCGGRVRERHVYLSVTRRVEVTIITIKFKNEPVYFILKYEGNVSACLTKELDC